jgi:hypothetical protein
MPACFTGLEKYGRNAGNGELVTILSGHTKRRVIFPPIKYRELKISALSTPASEKSN